MTAGRARGRDRRLRQTLSHALSLVGRPHVQAFHLAAPGSKVAKRHAARRHAVGERE